jgi:hypothetical protein
VKGDQKCEAVSRIECASSDARYVISSDEKRWKIRGWWVMKDHDYYGCRLNVADAQSDGHHHSENQSRNKNYVNDVPRWWIKV